MQRQPIDWTPRRTRRGKVSLTGYARWPDGSAGQVLVTDISYDGCLLWSDHQLEYGETLTLTLPGRGTIDAQVRWISDGCAGARFLTGSSAVDDRRARIGV